MLVPERRGPTAISNISQASDTTSDPEASCLYALITSRRSVSRRNRASWYLRQLNKLVKCDPIELIERDDAPSRESPDNDDEQENSIISQPLHQVNKDEKDIFLLSATTYPSHNTDTSPSNDRHSDSNQRFLVTPKTRVLYLSKSIATSIILDLSPSIVSVSAQNDCVFLDSMFDGLKRVLHLLVKEHEFQSTSFTLCPKVYVSVIAYTPFVMATNNQVLIQNRRISAQNIEQVLVELWICMNRIVQELHELVTNTCGINFEYESTKLNGHSFVSGGVVRHPGSVLEDIFDIGLFSSSLMPRLSRLSILIITDGLFATSNNLFAFRLRSIAVSFLSLASESVHPDACFGYTTYTDLMQFVARSTQGVHISHHNLMESSCNLSKAKQIPITSNPLFKIFTWTLHSDLSLNFDEFNQACSTPKAGQGFGLPGGVSDIESMAKLKPDNITKLFCIDQPMEIFQSLPLSPSDTEWLFDPDLVPSQNYHDWRSFKQLSKNLDADFEQVLACFLREGYLIKNIHLKHRETSTIVARLVLYWRHNVTLEQELTAPYWNSADPFDLSESNNMILKPFLAPSYGDTHCQVNIHGSYNFLYDFYCEKKTKRRSEYRALSYKQFEALIMGVKQTYDKLQYLSRFYRDPSLSKVPSFLLHGNSLLFEQPHTHNLTSTIDNVVDKTNQSREFSEYWQEISRLEQRNWRNLMHTHTLRLILEHDQPKHKNIHCQNANGRFTHIQCRRAMSAISSFIKSYASFALLEDSIYVKLIHNKDDDLRDIETSATKGFIVIKIKKILPIVVVYLMFTSGILDSHRVQIVAYIESQLVNCRMRTANISATLSTSLEGDPSGNILKSKVIYPSSDACCIQIRSPLERMLRIYSRNTLNEFLAQNLTHGLPGTCPYNNQQHLRQQQQQQQQQQQHVSLVKPCKSSDAHAKPTRSTLREQHVDPPTVDELPFESSSAGTGRYDPVFGKYLYGIRLVHTLSNLPHDLVQPIVVNVLAKISAILVNVRIKQGFHIAYNKSGLLTLVAELSMKDFSHEFHSSNCLCQYLVFPPAITNCGPSYAAVLQSSGQQTNGGPANIGLPTSSGSGGLSSKPGSLSGSLGNSESSFMRQINELTAIDDSSPTIQQADNQGEVKVIREYWIEQQYGISSTSGSYHRSLENMRYPEVVDHLYQTDISIFNCLLTYDLLQLLCDKMSPFYDLDMALSQAESRSLSVLSPTTSTSSSVNMVDPASSTPNYLPSNLIDGTTKDGISRVPLIELDYEFSLVGFLDYCQFASLDMLLFLDHSEFFDKQANIVDMDTETEQSRESQPSKVPHIKGVRKTSMDITHSSDNSTQNHLRREHRSSYDSLSTTNFNYNYVSPIYSPSLNHLFLETLHKRLKQMHDKELRLSELDRCKLTSYLRRRKIKLEFGGDAASGELSDNLDGKDTNLRPISWRCFMRKGNQKNLLIVLIPNTLSDITNWSQLIQAPTRGETPADVCPIFIFRCSSSMIIDQILAFLNEQGAPSPVRSELDYQVDQQSKLTLIENDIVLHFGRPCKFLGKLRASNDELESEILPLNKFTELTHASSSDEKTLEFVHFRAFLRKIKNTVLKSRFSSLNDAYLSELFVHKDDIQYYITNVDCDTQKKYHVSSHLKSLAEFVRSYEDYRDSLPKDAAKPCNHLLNSILLQKCGLFINQPMARFNEANPLMKQLHDRKLVFLMRCNYKVELPMLEENISNSTFLKKYIKTCSSSCPSQVGSVPAAPLPLASNGGNSSTIPTTGTFASSLGRTSGSGARLMDIKCGSIAGSVSTASVSGSPVGLQSRSGAHLAPRFGPTGAVATPPMMSALSPSNENFFLEAFKNVACSIEEIVPTYLDARTLNDIGLRHEAHMAEVLKRKSERKESQHYRRVLKSKASYNQSHGAIDQALKRVDSLGRLEHFCLTPLLFSPSWRSKLAPVRDHTIEGAGTYRRKRTEDSIDVERTTANLEGATPSSHQKLRLPSNGSPAPGGSDQAQDDEEETSERWHQTICYNYIKEYEQYIQTLGFNSVQVRYAPGSKLASSSGFASHSSSPTTSTSMSKSAVRKSSLQASASPMQHHHQHHYQGRSSHRRGPTGLHNRRESLASPSSSVTSTGGGGGGGFVSLSNVNPAATLATSTLSPMLSTHNTGYLIKFLNSGCLVFKVGFCKPYVYSILYSIEGERFNNSNMKMNMTAFLDELDSIKVTLHLHSFTYDYHLRSMFSYISRRQMNFSPGYHLISFVDDFRKYYQKAPNYARNHILSGEISVSNLRVNGQQLYNYIVTHNSVYQLDVLGMTNSMVADLINTFSSNSNNSNNSSMMASSPDERGNKSAAQGSGGGSGGGVRNHANDYVLIELKREKVHYKDGKDPDIFESGLLITHDHQQSHALKNCLVLKYFLLLTNQRDLYPKLVHAGDNIITLGCHRPIRLGLMSQSGQKVVPSSNPSREPAGGGGGGGGGVRRSASVKSANSNSIPPARIVGGSVDGDALNAVVTAADVVQPAPESTTTTTTNAASLDDLLHSSEFLSSGELSGPQSINSTVNSMQSSSSAGQQQPQATAPDGATTTTTTTTNADTSAASALILADHDVSLAEVAADALAAEELQHVEPTTSKSIGGAELREGADSTAGADSASSLTLQVNNPSACKQTPPVAGESRRARDRTICDEEITYLGYFSSDEMDMLRFLQEKTASLRQHLDRVVRTAEVHYRRDYLWHRLMQHQPSGASDHLSQMSKSLTASSGSNSAADQQLPLTIEELVQLLQMVEAIDLAALDPNLSTFTTMHINWYLKLLKAFNELKQASNQAPQQQQQHRIYTVKASKILLLYIDPKCTGAFILLSINNERGSVELSMLLKDKQECSKPASSGGGGDQQNGSIKLDQECQQLISDFINFCATFMWSNLLT